MVFNVVISIKEKSVSFTTMDFVDEGVLCLGNCWFIAGAGAVTLNSDLLQRVVPPNQSFDEKDYAGRIFENEKRND